MYTLQQQRILSTVSRCLHSVGFLCGSRLLYLSVRRRRKGIYHRLHIGIACHLIVDAAWAMYGRAAVPADTEPEAYGARGTTATCTAQGFFNQISVTIWLYYSALSVYSYVAVTNRFNAQNYKHVEVWIHLAVHIYPLATALYVLNVEGFNFGGNFGCYIASIPAGCTKDPDVECERGPDNIERVGMIVSGLPVFVCILFPTVVMVALYCHQRRQATIKTTEMDTLDNTRAKDNSHLEDKRQKNENETSESQQIVCPIQGTQQSIGSIPMTSPLEVTPKNNERGSENLTETENTYQQAIEGPSTESQLPSPSLHSHLRQSEAQTPAPTGASRNIEATTVLRQGTLYLLVLYLTYVFPMISQIATQLFQRHFFLFGLLSICSLALQGCWILLIYMWFSNKKKKKKQQKNVTNNHNDGRNYDNDDLASGHHSHTRALSTMRRSEIYESASAFNIFDGTNASEEFAAYVFSSDDDGDDHCEIDDDEDFEKDIADFIEAVGANTVQAPGQRRSSNVGYGPNEDKRESIYWSAIQDHV